MLQHIYGPLNAPAGTPSGQIIAFDQRAYAASSTSMRMRMMSNFLRPRLGAAAAGDSRAQVAAVELIVLAVLQVLLVVQELLLFVTQQHKEK